METGVWDVEGGCGPGETNATHPGASRWRPVGACFRAHPLQEPQQAAYRHLPAGRPADGAPREDAVQPVLASTYVHPADACLPTEVRGNWQQQEAYFAASLPKEPAKAKVARGKDDLEPPDG